MLPEFRIFGQGISNPVPLEELFSQKRVEKVSASNKVKQLEGEDVQNDAPSAYQSHSLKAYRAAASEDDQKNSLRAAQVMTSPVVSVFANEEVSKALDILSQGSFRHIPVLSEQQALIGMVSDRDIYRCMCSTGSGYKDKKSILIESIMEKSVLTANANTDARFIARLFVEQRVGAMPIVEQGKLVGIVTRSDILKAVMLNLHLDIWE